MNDSLLTMLKRIYDSEINVKITSDWDAGFTICTGDEHNSFTPESCGLEAEQLEDALREEVLEHYPNSKFARGVEVEKCEYCVGDAQEFVKTIREELKAAEKELGSRKGALDLALAAAKKTGEQPQQKNESFCCHMETKPCENTPKWNIHCDGDPPEIVTQMCDKHLSYHCDEKGYTRVGPIES